jgi:hypothetical protein
VQPVSAEGKFEFKTLPLGEYRVFGLGKSGQQDVVWQEFVDIKTPSPQYLELQTRLP